jgi:predicted amidohydrolase
LVVVSQFIGFVKVAAAVPAVKVADCKFNAQQTEKQIVIADGKGIQIIVFPELNLQSATFTAGTAAATFTKPNLI